jgi:hypothetical protein
MRLLTSSNKDDIISGAYSAGESRSQDYVPLLLRNAADPRRSTNLRYYGITVYQAKMIALKKIFDKNPPNKIAPTPDSGVILFYIHLFDSVRVRP